MGQLRTILIVFLLSIPALAQIEFNNVIETNMERQNGLADDVATATRLAESIEAESDDFEKPMTDNYKNIKTGNSEAVVTDSSNSGSAANQERKPTSEKDFSVKLKPTTGTDSALKYFPNLKKQKKSSRKIAKVSYDKTEDYLTSAKKTKTKVKKLKSSKTAKTQNLVKAKKPKKVAKVDKKKKPKNRTTASN